MEDYILREIDKLYNVLMLMAQKLGLWSGGTECCTVADLKDEMTATDINIDLEALLQRDNPIAYLVEEKHLSDKSLELFVDLLFHTDLDESKKSALLKDTIAYLESRNYISFRLYSLM